MGESYIGPFFNESPPFNKQHQHRESESLIIGEAKELLSGNVRLFSHRFFPVGAPPDWFLNPVNEKCFKDPQLHWSRLGDFDSGVGDIKCVWETSRFNWAPKLATAYRFSRERKYLETINRWVSDWTWKNPLNCGPNWKCGQETSIRMLNLMLTAFLLKQDRTPTAGLIRFAVGMGDVGAFVTLFPTGLTPPCAGQARILSPS